MDNDYFMKKNDSVSDKEMLYFFAKNITAIGSWPLDAEKISLERLPTDVSNNTIAPEMPWYAEANDDYLEFRRLPFWSASGTVFMGVVLSLLSISFLIISIISLCITRFDSGLLFLYLLSLFFGLCILPGAAKIAFFTPHYLPIRLNRKTQKVYFSDLIIEKNIFFGKIKLVFHEMDWKDVEAWSLGRVFGGHNMPYFGLHLVENHSNDISMLRQTRMYATRSPWSAEEMERQRSYIPKIWSYCQHYMAYMPVPDVTNEPHPFIFQKNNFLFKWPEVMDKRSRSSKEVI